MSISSSGPGNGPHHTAEPPAKGWSVLAPKISPPLSWDGRDDGQQAWVAERSTALTRSSRIETAISRGGDKGVLSVAEYFILSHEDACGGHTMMAPVISPRSRLKEGSTLPFVWLGWVCHLGCLSKDCPRCHSCPSLSLYAGAGAVLGSRLDWRWGKPNSLLLLKRLVDAGSSPTQRLKNKC